jgi:hypothetical protein
MRSVMTEHFSDSKKFHGLSPDEIQTIMTVYSSALADDQLILIQEIHTAAIAFAKNSRNTHIQKACEAIINISLDLVKRNKIDFKQFLELASVASYISHSPKANLERLSHLNQDPQYKNSIVLKPIKANFLKVLGLILSELGIYNGKRLISAAEEELRELVKPKIKKQKLLFEENQRPVEIVDHLQQKPLRRLKK